MLNYELIQNTIIVSFLKAEKYFLYVYLMNS